MDRYTRKDCEAALGRLASALGLRVATSYGDVGGLQLDYAACYGGYAVGQIANAMGGVSAPFGHWRVPAREFCERLSVACRAIELAGGTR